MIKTHLERHWDVDKVCRNPHKGWYLHYYDNRLDRYGSRLAEGDFLQDFPGLNHLYLRLAWSYLEPQEGRYDWEVIDRVIEPWTKQGYGIAFRITCKETSSDQCFATPQWVMEAGASSAALQRRGRRSCAIIDAPITESAATPIRGTVISRVGEMPVGGQ